VLVIAVPNNHRATTKQNNTLHRKKRFFTHPLMKQLEKQLEKQLAIRLTQQKTLSKSLVIAIRLSRQTTPAKSLVMTRGSC